MFNITVNTKVLPEVSSRKKRAKKANNCGLGNSLRLAARNVIHDQGHGQRLPAFPGDGTSCGNRRVQSCTLMICLVDLCPSFYPLVTALCPLRLP